MSALDIRVGDVVRLLDFKVTEVGAHFITGDYVGGSQGYSYPSRYVAEVISRVETDAEKIARLEAELAGLLNDVKAVEAAYEAENAGLRNDVKAAKAAEAAYEAELAKAPRRIEWGGGECPVHGSTPVAIWTRSDGFSCGQAATFEWSHAKSDDLVDMGEIIAYMVLPS